MDYTEFYKSQLGFEPYAFQKKVAELLLSGKNVILSVPTGAGKTWASVMPFLYARENDLSSFPQKMIYSLPLRTLANSIYKDISELLESDISSIQTGEYSDDPYFEKDLVLSTIDQTLSNFLCFPLALSAKQANINAGSIIGSYLVFDEFHLLDPKLSMGTTIGMLRILRNLCRVCIMTATLTDDYIDFLKKELPSFDVVSIKDFPDDVKQIKSLTPAYGKLVKKSISVCDMTLDSDMIIRSHKNKTIVICNRVETAQRLFIDLMNNKRKTTKVFCIHSRFFDSDRKERESKIKEYFGKQSKFSDVILVATQVIEAGMDISCDVMFTEISPINSFLQRIGRCARFANEYGDVYVCDVLNLEEREMLAAEDSEYADEIKLLNNNYLPYSKDLCICSMKALKRYNYIDEVISEKLVNEVLKADEIKKSELISANLYNLDGIRISWFDCDKKHYKKTIRDIQSLEIILVDVEKFQNMKITPWEYETISVYKWSFIGWIRNIEQEEERNSSDWIVAKADNCNNSQFDYDWQTDKNYYLKRIDSNQLKEHYDVVFVSNRYFDYSKAGLLVGANDKREVSPLKIKHEKEDIRIEYKKDTFYQHSKALLNCYENEFKPKITFLFRQLDEFWGIKDLDWNKLIEIAICFHDYGKLNDAWQRPMLEFQRKKMNDDDYFEILAHTDYDEATDVELADKCKISMKPAHAGIGALQVYEMLFDEYGEEIARAVSCAILKHHGVKTESYATFSISDDKLKDLTKLMVELDIDGNFIQREKGDSLIDIIPDNDTGGQKEWLLYLTISRILRLCDQKATESIDKYYTL